jgi:hypothetical protein
MAFTRARADTAFDDFRLDLKSLLIGVLRLHATHLGSAAQRNAGERFRRTARSIDGLALFRRAPGRIGPAFPSNLIYVVSPLRGIPLKLPANEILI